MAYYTPQTLPDALRVLAAGDVKIVAGCTDYFPSSGDGKTPPRLLDVTRLGGLRGVSRGPDGWTIGATTTWSDIVNADLPPAFDGLRDAARQVGSVQIQNAATIGGNLCNASPAADGVVALLTLNATLELQSQKRTRLVALRDFITGVRRIDLAADELVVALHVPALPDRCSGRFLKLGARKFLVISIVMVSVLVALDRAGRIETVRIAVGSCSAVAQRLSALETALVGRDAAEIMAQPDIWSQHLGALAPIRDVRGSAEFRLDAAAELCRRAVLGAMADQSGKAGD